MSSNIDPFFLFSHPGNVAALTQLLEPEKFEVIDVKKAIGPCNNTIAHVDILREDEDMDGLPIIVKTGIRRELMYDRVPLSQALHEVLFHDSQQRMYIEVDENFIIDEYSIANALRLYGLDVGDKAIKVNLIPYTDVVEIITTNKSLRFSDSARIAVITK